MIALRPRPFSFCSERATRPSGQIYLCDGFRSMTDLPSPSLRSPDRPSRLSGPGENIIRLGWCTLVCAYTRRVTRRRPSRWESVFVAGWLAARMAMPRHFLCSGRVDHSPYSVQTCAIWACTDIELEPNRTDVGQRC